MGEADELAVVVDADQQGSARRRIEKGSDRLAITSSITLFCLILLDVPASRRFEFQPGTLAGGNQGRDFLIGRLWGEVSERGQAASLLTARPAGRRAENVDEFFS